MISVTQRKRYLDYLQSKEWREVRERLFKERGKVCEKCKSDKNIQVHHKHYKNLFNERLKDLQVLCKYCHFDLHNKKNKSKAKVKKQVKKTQQQKNEDKIKKLLDYWVKNDCAKR